MMNPARHRGWSQIWQELTALLLIVGILCEASAALARTHRSRHRSRARSATATTATKTSPLAALPNLAELEPVPTGEAGGPDFPTLTRQLETAYRAAPTPELLYQLGLLAQLQGKSIEAQDLMRRYLADPLTPPGSAGRADAERMVTLPRSLHGEVQVVADDEGLILVGGRVVGALPLALPLLLPIGKYTVALEMQDRTMKATVEVLDGRGAEMRFSRESGAVVVTQPPSVIVLTELAGASVPAELGRRLQETTSKALQKARLAVYEKEAALRREPKQAGCLATLACQATLAVRTSADYVLRLQTERRMPEDLYTVSLQLVDAEVADIAAAAKVDCTRCTPDDLMAKLGTALRKVLSDGPGRPRGTLIVHSDPASAEIHSGAKLLGKTPYEHIVFTGQYDLTMQKSGYKTQTLQVIVQEGKKSTSRLALAQDEEPEPAPALRPPTKSPPSELRRPRWRLVTGGLALGIGLALAGLGVSGVVIDGDCVSPAEPPILHCRERFDTLGKGGALLGVGAALSLTGGVLLALPPRASQQPLSPQSQVTTTGTGITFSY